MPLYNAQEASWIARANAVVSGRRHLSDEEFTEVITSEDPPLKLRSTADWLLRMGKTMEAKENAKNEARAQEKVSRAELVMALMGFCTQDSYNQLMVYSMAMMKVLEEKGLVTKQEIKDQIAVFAKEQQEKIELAAAEAAAARETPAETTPVDPLTADAPIGDGIEEEPAPNLVN